MPSKKPLIATLVPAISNPTSGENLHNRRGPFADVKDDLLV
jgi:hypothetical protein